jgi:hypothetical protein
VLSRGPFEAVVTALKRTMPVLDDFEARFVLTGLPRDVPLFQTEEAALRTAEALRQAGATCEVRMVRDIPRPPLWRVYVSSIPAEGWAGRVGRGPRAPLYKAMHDTMGMDDFTAKALLIEVPSDIPISKTRSEAEAAAAALRAAGATCEVRAPDDPGGGVAPRPWGLYIAGLPEDEGGIWDKLRGTGPRGRAVRALRQTIRPPGSAKPGLDAFEMRWFLGKLPAEVDLFGTESEAHDAARLLRDAGVRCEVRKIAEP